MGNLYYEALGRAIWKGGAWYVRRRYVPVSRGSRVRSFAKRVGAGALVAVAIGAAVAAAQRRGGQAG